MGNEADDEIIGEIEINFTPSPQALADLAISLEEFEAALLRSLDERESLAEREDMGADLPPLEEIVLSIRGQVYQLEELANFEIRENPMPE